jgi:hypothetical protein
MQNKLIHIQHQNEIGRKTLELLQETLPDIEWEPFTVNTAPFQKYFIHLQIAAPPDVLTQQRMGLEIYAELKKVNGMSVTTDNARNWMDECQQLRYQADSKGEDWLELAGDFEIRIAKATYSNISYLGVGVPLYC